MKTRRAGAVDASDRAEIPVAAHVPIVAAEISDAPWIQVFAVLAVLLVTLTWLPLVKLTAPYEMGPNEGFNSYFQQAAATGGRIYGQPPEFVYANYPPFSFHLVGWIGLRSW